MNYTDTEPSLPGGGMRQPRRHQAVMRWTLGIIHSLIASLFIFSLLVSCQKSALNDVDAGRTDGEGVEDGGADGADVENGDDGVGDAGGEDAVEMTSFAYLVSQTYFVLRRELYGAPKGGTAAFLGWRSLPGDSDDMSFAVRRSSSFNEGDCSAYTEIATTTHNSYIDLTLSPGAEVFYCIQPVRDARPFGDPSNVVRVMPNTDANPNAGSISIRLDSCPGVAKNVGHVVISDVNGDGLTDFVFGYCEDEEKRCKDLPVFFGAAIRNEVGEWEVKWCKSAETSGDPARDWPLVAWDLNQDGKAEVITRTNNHRYLSVFNGEDGSLIAQADWPDQDPDRPNTYRNYTTVGMLDGIRPYVIIERYKNPGAIYSAFALSGNALTSRYRLITSFVGTHGLLTGDTDGDGRDEIITASALIEWDEATDQLVTRWIDTDRHCDLGSVGDFRPEIDGLEVFQAQEGPFAALLDKDGIRLWRHVQGEFYAWFPEDNPTEQNSDFDVMHFRDSVRCDFTAGWERGPCGILDETTNEILCATDDYCVRRCMGVCYCSQYSDCTPANRAAAEGIAFGDLHLFRPNGETASSSLLDDKYNLADWERGDGVAEAYRNPPGVNLVGRSASGPVKADVFGDSRAEFIDFAFNEFVIYSNISEVVTRRITPLAGPEYFKAVARSGCGYTPNYNAVVYPTFAISCDRAKYSEQDAMLSCAVSSIMNFSQSVTLSCEGNCSFTTRTVDVPANGSVAFTVAVAPGQATTIRVQGRAEGQVRLTRAVIIEKQGM